VRATRATQQSPLTSESQEGIDALERPSYKVVSFHSFFSRRICTDFDLAVFDLTGGPIIICRINNPPMFPAAVNCTTRSSER
jgi:hypothetical protein